MAVSVATGGATVNAALTAATWTVITWTEATPSEVHLSAGALTDVQYAYGVADGGSLVLGHNFTGSIAIKPPKVGTTIAVRSTAGGTVAVSAVK